MTTTDDPAEIPAEYVDNAARAYYDAAGVHWDTLAASDQEVARWCLRAALESFVKDAIPDLIPVAVEMVRKELNVAEHEASAYQAGTKAASGT